MTTIYKDAAKKAQNNYTFYSIREAASAAGADVATLPYSLRILLESLVRQSDGVDILDSHIEDLLVGRGEVPFKPARVILQDLTGVPVVVDLAAMREAFVNLGGDGTLINPDVPVDLVIDHSVHVDYAGTADALAKNIDLEFERNNERYEFLKWAQKSFTNYRAIPPGTGIIHQVNIEYLSDVVSVRDGVVFPDSMFGTDSHTTMINGLGVLGWGVGGIEAEASMLGEASFFPTPEVIGVRLVGKLPIGANATDLALKVTQVLRAENVVGKFVEFFGEGYKTLALADRATVSNMAPEYGATCGYFPIDDETINYLELTGRSKATIELIKEYTKANDLFYDDSGEASYTKVIELDLSEIQANLSGPKRPQDLIPLTEMKEKFIESLPTGELEKEANGIKTGQVAIAAITSCTNTSNPYVLIAAGLLAKAAVEHGLKVNPNVKTSLAPGSKVVTRYLKDSGLLPYLEQLGFNVVGYGCTTCIGNSGNLKPEIEKTISENDLYVTSVLSGNRNFEGRINPFIKANYLASPPLVVAYALTGNVNHDLLTEPIAGDVYLADIWPEAHEIQRYITEFVTPAVFSEEYENVENKNEKWNSIATSEDTLYTWDPESTYIANPPYFENMSADEVEIEPLNKLRVLASFGDSVTTDHISPAGNIALNSPAAKYLKEHGVEPAEFNSYGSRRGHHEVMMRGTFANIRINNKLAGGQIGGVTTYFPTNEIMPIYDASMKYKEAGTGLVILAGNDYGMGSSRDWAAKGTQLQGVKAVIAKSYERIHRSNLVMMGVLPLQFMPGEDAESLGLTGEEEFSIAVNNETGIGDVVTVVAGDKEFKALVRFDAAADIRYYKNQGILPMVIRKKLQGGQ
ncbi:MAG: aconitate hydratase AcnA [Lactobacillales bacterium]|jgi:aconitate hydratase|nr:aconitate hydratase AcnA [Lactobacillales bacterium]